MPGDHRTLMHQHACVRCCLLRRSAPAALGDLLHRCVPAEVCMTPPLNCSRARLRQMAAAGGLTARSYGLWGGEGRGRRR